MNYNAFTHPTRTNTVYVTAQDFINALKQTAADYRSILNSDQHIEFVHYLGPNELIVKGIRAEGSEFLVIFGTCNDSFAQVLIHLSQAHLVLRVANCSPNLSSVPVGFHVP